MNKYYALLSKKKSVTNEIFQEKRRLHRKFVEINSTAVKVLDIALVLMICLNFGAVVITNMMVVKDKPQIVFQEANPIQGKVNNYEVASDAVQFMKALVFQIFLWSFIVACYMYYRRNIFTENGLYVMYWIAIYYVLMITFDFMNDFGYLLGKMAFG